ncbi:restriction endonuclease subunit S [Glaesserella parasuis]|uniref:restriction endonuclease subunit S n=1 Tax=Glaesserella parasuis TaxID=738 RepID=UPI003B1BCEF8
MSSWELKKLSEVADIIGGATPKSDVDEYFNGDIPWITPKDLSGYKNRYISKGERNITKLGLENSSAKLLPKGAVLFTSRAPIGYVAIADNEVSTNQGFKSLVLKDGNIPEFFYYLLKHNIPLFEARATGSTFKEVSGQVVKNTELLIPSIDIQKKIVDLVSPLDEKIELNTQINQTLEQIAQTIFKSWFIDFDPVHAKANALANGQTTEQATQAAMAVISGKNTQELHRLQTANPEQYQQLWEIAEAFPSGVDEEGVPRGWEQTTLSEVCSMKNGYAFKSSDWTEEGIPVIKIGSVKPMIVEVDGNGFVDEEHSVLHSEFLLTEGDIVVGLTGYVGEVGRIPQGRTAMLNQRVAKFIPNKLNEQQDYYSFVYCLVRDKSFKAFAETNAKGSAQANISTKELLNYSIILASSEIQMKFESLIKPLLDKILVNSGNNEYLSKVRDLLLPNLLSGEIHL